MVFKISPLWYVGVDTFLHKISFKELVFERFRTERNFPEILKQFHKVFTKLEPIVEKKWSDAQIRVIYGTTLQKSLYTTPPE